MIASSTAIQRVESHSTNSSSRTTKILRKVAGRNIGIIVRSNSSSSSSSAGLPQKDDVQAIIDDFYK